MIQRGMWGQEEKRGGRVNGYSKTPSIGWLFAADSGTTLAQ